MEATSVTHPLTLDLLTASGSVLPLEAEFSYSTTDPLAVVAMFHTGESEPVRWVFARDLLSEGMDHRTGDGDMVVWPAVGVEGAPAVHIRLRSPDGDALLEADAAAVQQFLKLTWALVTPGTEGHLLDVESVLGSLLDGS